MTSPLTNDLTQLISICYLCFNQPLNGVSHGHYENPNTKRLLPMPPIFMQIIFVNLSK